MSVAENALLDKAEEVLAIGVVKEYLGATVATQHDVVQRAGIMDSWLASHAQRVSLNQNKINTSPA